jgi:hypothetical protein
LEAQGNLGGESIANEVHTYYHSVAMNTQGVVAYGYSASSPTTNMRAFVSTGITDQSYTVQIGLAPYNRVINGRNQWGGYSGISVDPTDDSFWIFNQFADMVSNDGKGHWGTVGFAWNAWYVGFVIVTFALCVLKG